ncbi:MAG: acyl-CoA/acyl-ACP dehydrogenase [Deltaproteobacteria bacterium]|nr:acyl-CoA/acyl-ACP dehydrogenase [Deltaproteobacteria bacterium]
MRFRFTEDQTLFRDAAREMLARHCGPEVVRAAYEQGAGAPDAWRHLAEQGISGMLLPEAQGGLGLGMCELILILEETGFAALSEPVVETVAVAGPLLEECGATALLARWAPAIAGGRARVGLGLDGQPYVEGADRADLLLMERAGELHALTPERALLTAQASVDGARRLFTVQWAEGTGTRVAQGEMAARALARARLRATLGTAAQLIGLGARCVELAVEYAKVRTQFGRPIGAFQAVQHKLVDAFAALAMARPAVYRAAWSLDRGDPEVDLHVSMAKAQASDAATLCTRSALQCHGAIGYTTEYDLHLYMKRAWALSRAFGDSDHHRARIARQILGD